MVVRRIGVVSLAKISTLLYGILGLVLGAVFSLIALLFSAAFRSEEGAADPFTMMFGAASIVWMPILYACIGFVGAVIGAALYNLAAAWVGGVELELREPGPPAQPVPPATEAPPLIGPAGIH